MNHQSENGPVHDDDGVSDTAATTVSGVAQPQKQTPVQRQENGATASCDTSVGDQVGITTAGMAKRLSGAGKALVGNAGGAGPLPGLELANVENTAENYMAEIALGKPAKPNPLPGTTIQKDTENAGKSSSGRSPQRFCYTTLLHNAGPRSAKNSQNCRKNWRQDCYSIFDRSTVATHQVASQLSTGL
jgi:hypothetical protein